MQHTAKDACPACHLPKWILIRPSTLFDAALDGSHSNAITTGLPYPFTA
jgi:hypothetical protein